MDCNIICNTISKSIARLFALRSGERFWLSFGSFRLSLIGSSFVHWGVPYNIDNRRLNIDNRRLDINNRRLDIDNRGIDIDNRGIDIDNRRIDIDNRGIDIGNLGIDIDNRRIDIDNRRLDIGNRGIDIDNRRLDIDNRGIDIDDLTSTIEESTSTIDESNREFGLLACLALHSNQPAIYGAVTRRFRTRYDVAFLAVYHINCVGLNAFCTHLIPALMVVSSPAHFRLPFYGPKGGLVF